MADDWRRGSVLEQQKYMLETGYRSDCSFLVGQEPDTKEFHVHKAIMSRSSDVFDAMFYGALSEKGVVRVRDVTPEAFQALLYHVYCDTLEISDVEMLLSVCSAAHKYNLQPLITKCADYIAKHMTPVNVCQVLEFSNLIDNTQLKTHCIKMLQKYTEAVLSADSWCGVQESSIVTLLQQDTLNVHSELTLLSACQRWAQHQLDINNQPEGNNKSKDNMKPDVNISGDKLREILAPLLPYIRFLSLNPKQFLQATKNNQIFSDIDKLLILQSLVEPKEYKMPVGMCKIDTPRNHSAANDILLLIIESHLDVQPIVTTSFVCYHYNFRPSARVPLVINNTLVVYGFWCQTLELSHLNPKVHAPVLKNKIYRENFTVLFINETDKSVVAECKYEGMLKYDTRVKVDFRQSFLLEKNIPYSLKVEFHHQHTDRLYPLFYKPNDSTHVDYDCNFTIPLHSAGVHNTFPCISKLIYKKIAEFD